ncbi:MAG TPA: AMP-binding protein, partial [Pseudolysinimonas sp.]|nr:AMP-binding protein [Pseudolysinimonas sp.]
MDSELFIDIQRPYAMADARAAWLFCDRHDPSAIAYTFVDGDESRSISYGELRDDSVRLANGLRELGVGPGTRVATLVRKGPELVTTMLAVWRLGAVYVPLFTAFAQKAVDLRMRAAEVRVVVTDSSQRSKIPEFAHDVKVLVVDGGGEPGDIDYRELFAAATADPFESHAQGADGALVHIFTSGTTGSPKGVIHPLQHVA